MDREDIQLRRADNQIWNAAGDYSLRPDCRAFDPDGDAALYFNTVIGLAMGCYDFARFRPLLNSFRSQAQGELYEGLFWLAMEGLVYRRFQEQRPALAALRRDYARGVLAEGRSRADRFSLANLRAAWFLRALGQPGPEDEWERAVLDGLTLPVTLSEGEIAERLEALLHRCFHRARRSLDDRQWAAWVGRTKRRSGGLVSRRALRRLARTDAEPGDDLGAARRVWLFLQGKTPEPQLRRYVEAVFGRPLLEPEVCAQAERTLCTGAHAGCRLHITRGQPTERRLDSQTAWEVETFRRQREKNRAYFRSRLAQNRLVISRLSQHLQNALLLQQDESQALTRAGRLSPPVCWRAALGDERLFARRQEACPGELMVDLLLDGSASQNRQQEKLATQAYIIAESLTRCHIPVRVSSYCSVSGCTVLRILRDYGDRDNEGLFDYVATGWNRDGLALRAMGWLLRREGGQRRMLIVLSDANPNDDQRLPGRGPFPGRAYGGRAGLEDAAREAAALRLQGVPPLCVFTGGDLELPGARQIYGTHLTRIPSVGWFADTVGKLIRSRLKEME